MQFFQLNIPLGDFFTRRIYRLFFSILLLGLTCSYLYCQDTNAYRTISSGLFSDIGIWEVYDGISWQSASSIPSSSNDIYIDQTHTLSLLANQSVKSLFINSETGAGQKLILNGNALEIHGTLQAFSGAAPGSPTGTWNSTNWIGNSIDSRLVFKGNSRIIIPKDGWSGFSIRSRYSVIFDPGDGTELRIQEPLKSMRFIVMSGTLIQELDTSVSPGDCASLSFNTENFFALDEYGELIIEDGGIFISECNEDIIFRSSTKSAADLELEDGGEIILRGDNPEMEVVNYQLDGKITFESGSSPKTFVSKSYSTSNLPLTLHDLEIRSSEDLILPANLTITGDLIQSSSGEFDFTSTSLELSGSDNQQINDFPLIVWDLTLNKPIGEVSLNRDLTILSTLNLIEGGLDLNQNELNVNLLGTGGLNYVDGYWRDLSLFTYFNLPSTLDQTNFTLPFLDQYQGGIRKVQLFGNSPNGNLSVSFTEYEGADYDPMFSDSDGTPILYRLFSYFTFSGLSPSANSMELRISADELIVDNVDDLRIVATGYPAPGSHLPGLDPSELWARRTINFEDLEGPNLTIGSYRTLSILPVAWLDLETKVSSNLTLIHWTVSSEKNNEKFEIYRSSDGLSEWIKLGQINSIGDTASPRVYSYPDSTRSSWETAYYRIKQIDLDGQSTWSEVTKSDPSYTPEFRIFPNPYSSGPIQTALPEGFIDSRIHVSVFSSTGRLVYHGDFNKNILNRVLPSLPSGLYVIQLENSTSRIISRWVRK